MDLVLLLAACVTPEKQANAWERDTGGSTIDTGESSPPADSAIGDSSPDSADSAPTDTATSPTGPCDWAALERPYWAFALPWILQDPALTTGIAGWDDGTDTLVGSWDGAAFTLDVVPSAEAIYTAVRMDGTFDAATGDGAWTLTWTLPDGSAAARSVQASWAGCTLAEHYPLNVPGIERWAYVVDADRYTTFVDGTAFSVGSTVSSYDRSCNSDMVGLWSSRVSVGGQVSAVGEYSAEGTLVETGTQWTLSGEAWHPVATLDLHDSYRLCGMTAGTGGSATAGVRIQASRTAIYWDVERSWALYDADRLRWYLDGSGTLDGRAPWDGTGEIDIDYTEIYSGTSGDATETADCAGTWTADDGATWECDVDPGAGLDDWAEPPVYGAWAW